MISSGSERNLLEVLAEEFAERLRRGEKPSLEEYAAQHPHLAKEIRELFPTLAAMEKLKPGVGDLTTNHTRASAAPAQPARLGEYRILREIGRGGMGIVYEAEQESLGRRVALKVLPSHSMTDPNRLIRFKREAHAAACLHHTNIVPVYGVGEAGGMHFYAMQFINGLGLDQVLLEVRRLRQTTPGSVAVDPTAEYTPQHAARSLLDGDDSAPATHPVQARAVGTESISASVTRGTYWERVARIGMQAADALAHAHSQSVLHRDIKPSNLLLDHAGIAWVTDFGLAKLADSDDLTGTGDIIGTLRYMAPERFEGQCDGRADIYALGLTLYEFLALRPAFEETGREKLISQVTQSTPPPPSSITRGIPRDLETIVLKAIARDPGHRYQTAGEMAEDLQRFVEDRPILARRLSLSERFTRWSRRNPVIATLTATVAVLLATAAVGSTIAAMNFSALADSESNARSNADIEKKKAQDGEQEIKEGLARLHRANGLLESAQRHELQKEWGKAIAACTSAIEQRPDNSQVWAARGKLYLRIGLLDEAAEDFARLFEMRPPNEPSWWFFHACLRLHRNDMPGYRKVCRDMVEHFPPNPNPELVRWYSYTCTLAPGALDDPTKLSRLVEQAAARSGPEGDFAVARLAASYRAGQFREAVVENGAPGTNLTHPQDIAAHCFGALLHHALKQTGLAKQEFSSATYKLEFLSHQTAYRSLAKDAWDSGLGIDPPPVNDDHLADWLAACLLYREVMQVFDGKAEMHPLPWQIRGRSFAILGKRQEAMVCLEHAIGAKPNSSALHFQYGDLLASQKQWIEAEKAIDQAIALVPEAGSYAIRKRATELFVDYRKWDQAEAQFLALKKWVETPLRPLPMEISWLAAKINAGQQNWDEAARLYLIPLLGPQGAMARPKFSKAGLDDLRARNAHQRMLTREIAAQKEVYDRISKNLDRRPIRDALLVARVHLLASENQMDLAVEESVRALDLLSHEPNQKRNSLNGSETIFTEILRWEGMFDKVAKARPDVPGLWMARCGRFVFNHKWDDAARDWLKVEALIEDEEPGQITRLVLETTAIMNEELLKRVADRCSQKESLWLARARHLVSEKRWDEADGAYEKAIGVAKDPQWIWFARARTFLDQGELQKADAIYVKLIESKPGDIEMLMRISQEHVQLKRVNEAAAMFDKAVAAAPKDPVTLLTRARFLADQNRWQAAALDYNVALDLLPPESAKGMSRAIVYREVIDRNQKLFILVAELRPKNDPHPWLIQGQHFAGRRLWTFALPAFQKVVDRDPKNFRVWAEMGGAYANASDWDRSATAYLKCLELEPSNYAPGPGTPIRFEIARWDNVFARVTDRRGDDANLWAMRAHFLMENRRFDEADAIQIRLVKINPQAPRTWANRGNYYLVRQQWDKAEADFLMVSDLIAKGETSPAQVSGIYRNAANEPKILEALLAKRPKDAWLWDARAQRLAEQTKPLQDVEAAFAKALELRPKDPRILLNRARMYSNYEQWRLSARDFESALADSEIAKDSFVWYEWAVAPAAAGDAKSWNDISAKMLQQFGEPRTVLDGQRIAFTCSLMPNGPADSKKMLGHALEALDEHPNAIWNAFTVASARYRAGQYREIVAEHDAYRKQHSAFFQDGGVGLTMLLQIETLARIRLGQTKTVPPLLDRIATLSSPLHPTTRAPLQRLPGHGWACVTAYQMEIEGLMKQPK